MKKTSQQNFVQHKLDKPYYFLLFDNFDCIFPEFPPSIANTDLTATCSLRLQLEPTLVGSAVVFAINEPDF